MLLTRSSLVTKVKTMTSQQTSLRSISLRSVMPRNAPATPISPMVVNLTKKEDEICKLLDDFCTSRNAQRPDEEPVVCRIAGGWVRDKLLGVDSHDIDIAINTMTGEAFAQELLDAGKIKSIGATIASNPEQSKHLATTRLKILDKEIDLVNLRSEKYSKESRIPTVEFGTPVEDAERRDLTINALFYNVHAKEVEDFTGKGIDDLKVGRVRTPLEPKTTFEDDPLRVLRCIRFASRLGFAIDDDISQAAKEPSIQSMLATKISRERIGEEVDKMIRGPDPLYAVQLLHSFGLLPSILVPSPQALESHDIDSLAWDRCVKGVASLELLLSASPSDIPAVNTLLLNATLEDRSLRARLTLASLLSPFRGMVYHVKKKQVPVVDSTIRDGLKLGSQHHYLDGVPQLFAAADLIANAFPEPLQSGNRAEIGIFLRQPAIQNPITGSEWSASILFSLSQELIDCWEDETLNESKAAETIERYNQLATRIDKWQLQNGIKAQPIIHGKMICQILNMRPSPKVGVISNSVIRWQLENPESGVEECTAWLQDQAAKGAFGELPLAKGDEPAEKRKKRKADDPLPTAP